MQDFSCQSYDESSNCEECEDHFILMYRVKGLRKDSEKARRDLLLAYVEFGPLKNISNFRSPVNRKLHWDVNCFNASTYTNNFDK